MRLQPKKTGRNPRLQNCYNLGPTDEILQAKTTTFLRHKQVPNWRLAN